MSVLLHFLFELVGDEELIFLNLLHGLVQVQVRHLCEEEVADLLVEILRELDTGREDEHLELVVDPPGCLLDYHVLVAGPDLDHGVAAGPAAVPAGAGVVEAEPAGVGAATLAEDHPVDFRVRVILNEYLVDVDVHLGVPVLVNQVRARHTLHVDAREHLVEIYHLKVPGKDRVLDFLINNPA